MSTRRGTLVRRRTTGLLLPKSNTDNNDLTPRPYVNYDASSKDSLDSMMLFKAPKLPQTNDLPESSYEAKKPLPKTIGIRDPWKRATESERKHTAEIEANRKEMCFLKNEIDGLKLKCNALGSQLNVKMEEIKKQKLESVQLKSEVKHLKCIESSDKRNHQELLNQLHSLKSQTSKLEKENQDLKALATTKVDSNSLATKLTDLESKLAHALTDSTEKNQEAQHLLKENSNLQNLLANVQKELEQKESEVNDTSQNLKNKVQECNELISTNQSLSSTITNARIEIQELQKNNTTSNSKLESDLIENRSLIDSLKSEVQSATDKIEENERLVDSLTQQLTSATDTQQSLQKSNTSLQQAIDTKDLQLKLLQDEPNDKIKALEEAIDVANSENTKLNQELLNQKSEAKVIVDKLQNKIDQSKTKEQQLASSLSDTQARLSILQNQFDQSQNEKQQLLSNLSDSKKNLETTVATLQNEISQSKTKEQQLVLSLSDKQKRLEELQLQYENQLSVVKHAKDCYIKEHKASKSMRHIEGLLNIASSNEMETSSANLKLLLDAANQEIALLRFSSSAAETQVKKYDQVAGDTITQNRKAQVEKLKRDVAIAASDLEQRAKKACIVNKERLRIMLQASSDKYENARKDSDTAFKELLGVTT